MKKLGHLGVYTLLVFLSIYLLDFSSLYLAKMFVWGMDGYSIIVAVEQLLKTFFRSYPSMSNLLF